MSFPGQDNYIFSSIKRCNKNLLIVNGFILLLILIAGFAAGRYLYNFLLGPFNIDNQSLISIKDPDKLNKYFCNVTGTEVYDSGVQYIIQNVDKYTNRVTSERIEAYYYILGVNKKFLIVKTSDDKKNHSYAGALIKIPGDVRTSILEQVKERKTDFLPFMLDATNFRTNGYWGLGICIPILLIAVWNLMKFVQRNNNPEDHPLYKQLGKYGVPSDIAYKINDEILTGSVRTGSIIITPSWLIVERYFKVDLEHLSDIMWIYKKITTHKAYGVVTTGQTFEICIMTRKGNAIYTTGKELHINEIINNVSSKAPWVIAGFSNEIKDLWDKQRDLFINTVDQKRAETGKSPEKPEEG